MTVQGVAHTTPTSPHFTRYTEHVQHLNPMATATHTHQINFLDKTYNGWTNYKTWNVVLWIENDESIQSYIQDNDVCCYEELLEGFYDCGSKETPDGVEWNDPEINRAEINGDVFDF